MITLFSRSSRAQQLSKSPKKSVSYFYVIPAFPLTIVFPPVHLKKTKPKVWFNIIRPSDPPDASRPPNLSVKIPSRGSTNLLQNQGSQNLSNISDNKQHAHCCIPSLRDFHLVVPTKFVLKKYFTSFSFIVLYSV